MSSHSHFQQLMREIGPRMKGTAVARNPEETRWALGFEDGTLVAIQYEAASGRLVISLEVGQPASASRLNVYQALLTYNHLWRETGGVRLALDGQDGAVILLFDLFFNDLDPGTFATVVTNLMRKAETWRSLIEQIGASESTDRAEPAGGESFGDAIRV